MDQATQAKQGEVDPSKACAPWRKTHSLLHCQKNRSQRRTASRTPDESVAAKRRTIFEDMCSNQSVSRNTKRLRWSRGKLVHNTHQRRTSCVVVLETNTQPAEKKSPKFPRDAALRTPRSSAWPQHKPLCSLEGSPLPKPLVQAAADRPAGRGTLGGCQASPSGRWALCGRQASLGGRRTVPTYCIIRYNMIWYNTAYGKMQYGTV